MNLAILLSILVALSILLLFLVLLWKKGFLGKLVSLVIPVGLSYSVFTAIYPQDSFYINDFERVTGLSLPKSVRVLYKNADYPDFQGDYVSEAIFELPKKQLKRLTEPKNSKSAELCNTKREMENRLDESLSIVHCKTIKRQGVYFYWNIYSDGKTIYYLYSGSQIRTDVIH